VKKSRFSVLSVPSVVKKQFSGLSAVSAVKTPIRDAETEDNTPLCQQEPSVTAGWIGTAAAGETRCATDAQVP
jgi:hypothetical protein